MAWAASTCFERLVDDRVSLRQLEGTNLALDQSLFAAQGLQTSL